MYYFSTGYIANITPATSGIFEKIHLESCLQLQTHYNYNYPNTISLSIKT